MSERAQQCSSDVGEPNMMKTTIFLYILDGRILERSLASALKHSILLLFSAV
jgi:hypothetical protein